MLGLQEFIAQYQGQCLTYPGFSPCCQCTDLAAEWSANLGLPIFSGNAATYSSERKAPWSWVANTPTGVPSPGDLVVFHECSGEGVGSDGHVAIFVSGDVNSFTSFDQNWPDVGGPCSGGGSACHEVSHDYSCVVGWQHQTVLTTPTPTPSPHPTPSPIPVQPPPPGGLDWAGLLGYGLIAGGGAAVGVYFLHREGGSVRQLRDKYLGKLAPAGTGFQRRRGEWRTEAQEAVTFGKRVAQAQGFDPETPGVDWQAYGEEARYRLGRRQKVPSPAAFGAAAPAELGVVAAAPPAGSGPPRRMVRIGGLEIHPIEEEPARHRPQRPRRYLEKTTGRYRLEPPEAPVTFERRGSGWQATVTGPHGEVVGRGEAQSRALASQAALHDIRGREVLHRLDRYRRRGPDGPDCPPVVYPTIGGWQAEAREPTSGLHAWFSECRTTATGSGDSADAALQDAQDRP